MPKVVTTGRSRLEWSADGTSVTKRMLPDGPHFPLLGAPRAAALNEIRINRMLATCPAPVRTPRLLGHRTRERSITVEAIGGEALGPKYPLELHDRDLTDLIDLVRRLSPYRPRRRWFHRLRLDSRLAFHVAEGLVTRDDADTVLRLATDASLRWRFAHGDVTARNVLRSPTGELVLIDWEWAGLYPSGYDLAFLWYSMVDVPDGRSTVEAAVPAQETAGFLVSAVVLHLLHLHLWLRRPTPFTATHEASLEALLDRVRHLRP